MSEFPVEVPVQEEEDNGVSTSFLLKKLEEEDRLMFERKKKARDEYLAEHNNPVEVPVEEPVEESAKEAFERMWQQTRDPNERNILLNDPLLDPVLAQKIREGVRDGFCSYGDLSNKQIKERFRYSLEHLLHNTFPLSLAIPPPFKGILSIDQAYYEGMLTQARDTFKVCLEQLKYVMYIGYKQKHHHVKQAEALKDDPEKQTEYQAQWTKADEIYRGLVKIHKVILWMRNTKCLTILESFTQPGFLETPSSE